MPNPLEFADRDTLALSVAVAFFAVGAWLGSWFPDIDQKIRYLRHRSVVTHGFLMPATMLVGLGVTRVDRVDWFIAGFSVGVAVHLAFDLFPESWRGYALITIPGFGAMSKVVAMAWLTISVFVCLSIAVILAPGTAGIICYGVALFLLYAYGVLAQRERFVGPMLALLALGGGAAMWTVATNGRYFRDLLPL